MEAEDFRIEIDDNKETISKRIRNAEIEKIPYTIVLGQKEIDSGKLPIRERFNDEIKFLALDEFIEICKNQIPKPKKI